MKKAISFVVSIFLISALFAPCSLAKAYEYKENDTQAAAKYYDTLPYEGIKIPYEAIKTQTSLQNGTTKTNGKMFGDVDKNGYVKASDILQLMENLAGNSSAEDINTTFSDVNYDNSVDMLDVVTLQRHVAGWEGYEKLPYGADVYAGYEDYMPDILYYEPLETSGLFAYDTLNSQQKAFYNEIVAAAESMDNRILYSDMSSMEELLLCYFAVRVDHPEYFWLSNQYGYTDYAPYCLVLYYNCDIETRDRRISEIKSSLQDIVDHIGNTDYTDFEVEVMVHDYLIKNITYDNNAAISGNTTVYPNAWNVYGALVLDSCVCEGYAESFMLIMRMFGVETGVVTGSVHMWNYIMLDGEFYYVDVTWDDQDYGDKVYYNYLNMTYYEAEYEHGFYPIYSSASNDYIRSGRFNVYFPICTATKYNYIRYNSTVLDNPSTLVTDFANGFISQSAEAYKKGLTAFEADFYIEKNSGIDPMGQQNNILKAIEVANASLKDYTIYATSFMVNYSQTLITVSITIVK